MEISVDQMYRIENAGDQMGFPKKFMMENAGASAVRRLIESIGSIKSMRVLVMAGLGNNGGDGLVMARHMAGHGARVTAILLGDPQDIRTKECSWNWAILEKMPSVRLGHGTGDIDCAPGIIIDAILGTGIKGEIRDPYASAIEYINGCDCYTVAVDVPSGLDPDTGQTSNLCVKADMTVTFHKIKRGISKRPDMTGKLFAERIGIPPEAEAGIL